MDFVTIGGIILGLGGILLGNVIEGGHTSSLVQGAAAMIVFTGTLGAVIVSHRKEDLQLAWSSFFSILFKRKDEDPKQIFLMVSDLARLSRKVGVLGLQSHVPKSAPEFLKDLINYCVDGINIQQIRSSFETRLIHEEEKVHNAAKVWLDAGGFCPTIGILGAVLGLIHVMGNLSDTSQLGVGIAVAFVATIYGVGAANLLLIPIGNKIKGSVKANSRYKQMMIEGVVGIAQGVNPRLIDDQMNIYLDVKMPVRTYNEPTS